MNLKIKELGIKAGFGNVAGGVDGLDELEQFAKLIILESSNLALNAGHGDIEQLLLDHYNIEE
jgi:hypothetical protein